MVLKERRDLHESELPGEEDGAPRERDPAPDEHATGEPIVDPPDSPDPPDPPEADSGQQQGPWLHVDEIIPSSVKTSEAGNADSEIPKYLRWRLVPGSSAFNVTFRLNMTQRSGGETP